VIDFQVMADAAQIRVQDAVTQMINDLDKLTLRRMQVPPLIGSLLCKKVICIVVQHDVAMIASLTWRRSIVASKIVQFL
ncbi:unnamed protein product, partial [Notodromas monacha]